MVSKKQGCDSYLLSFAQNLVVLLLRVCEVSSRRLDGGVTLGLGRWQNLLRNAAGSEALENPRVQGLENFSATSPGRNASLLNRV